MSPAPVSAVASSSPLASWADFVSLTKPRLSGLVLFTMMGAMWLAHRPLSWLAWVSAVLGTAGTVGAANAFNCYFERASDQHMARTARRPMPAGRMDPEHGLAFAVVLACVSLPVLVVGVNALTALLGACALVSYVLLYTPMKAKSHWAMVMGALPGALPPLMGWTAATGAIEWPGVALFAILFVWQLPHFIAIALFRKAEYRAAGLTSLPLVKGDDVARWHALGYSVLLLAVSVWPALVGVAGPAYLAVAGVLGVGFVGLAVYGVWSRGEASWARRFFGASLVDLTGLFIALALFGTR